MHDLERVFDPPKSAIGVCRVVGDDPDLDCWHVADGCSTQHAETFHRLDRGASATADARCGGDRREDGLRQDASRRVNQFRRWRNARTRIARRRMGAMSGQLVSPLEQGLRPVPVELDLGPIADVIAAAEDELQLGAIEAIGINAAGTSRR